MGRRPDRETVLTGGGALAVAVGVALPWLRVNPTVPPDAAIPRIYIAGMAPGIAGFDPVLLGAAGVALLVQFVGSRERRRALVPLLAGGGTVLCCALYVLSSARIGFDATFVPALGWYLTVSGGPLLLAAGASRWSGRSRAPALKK